MKDVHSTYISCNEHYAKDLGIRAEDISGKTDFDFFPHPTAEKYRAEDQRILQNGSPEDREEQYLVQGRESTVRVLESPIWDSRGEKIGIVGLFWDISEQKALEEAWRREKLQLETALAERNQELQQTHEQLEAEGAERRRVEEARKDWAEKFVAVVEKAETGVQVIQDGATRFINPKG